MAAAAALVLLSPAEQVRIPPPPLKSYLPPSPVNRRERPERTPLYMGATNVVGGKCRGVQYLVATTKGRGREMFADGSFEWF